MILSQLSGERPGDVPPKMHIPPKSFVFVSCICTECNVIWGEILIVKMVTLKLLGSS